MRTLHKLIAGFATAMIALVPRPRVGWWNFNRETRRERLSAYGPVYSPLQRRLFDPAYPDLALMAGGATNKVLDPGYNIAIVATNPTTPSSGDPVRFGKLTGVAMLDEGDGGAGATETVVDLGPGVYDLSVDDNESGGISVGDTIYYHDTQTGSPSTSLNNSSTGMNAVFGIALEAVSSNATTTINVLHIPLGATIALGAGVVDTGELAADAVTSAKLDPTILKYTEVTLSSAQVKALKATPITLVTAPGTNLANVPVAINIVVNYAGSNAFTESSDDLSIGYASAGEIMEIESTGLIDQTGDEWRYITFEHAETFIPAENEIIEIVNLDDEIAGNAGNDNTIIVRLYYRTVPTDA